MKKNENTFLNSVNNYSNSLSSVRNDSFDMIDNKILYNLDDFLQEIAIDTKKQGVVKDILRQSYITANYNYEYFQKKFDNLNIEYMSQNRQVAVYANFLFYEFPKLPYFWGGGHEATSYDYFIGLDPNWGKDTEIAFDGSSSQPVGKKFPKSLDCSGFVTWCLINAGVDIRSYDRGDQFCLESDDCLKLGKIYSITEDNVVNIVKPGDVAYMDGHVGVITEVNKQNNTITVIHVSGSGAGINSTVMSLENGLVVEDDLGVLPEGYTKDRIGKQYFTHIVSVNYN